MKRLVWLPVAGFLLIAGAAVATASNQIFTVVPAEVPAATPAAEEDTGMRFRAGDLVEEVLADLIEQNVLTQEQSDAFVAALEAALDERRAEAEARMEQMRETWDQVRGFLEDGAITQQEMDTLPEDNPLREAFTSIAEDGEVTLDELRQLGPALGGPGLGGPGFGGRGHHGHGPDRMHETAPNELDSDT